MATEAATPLIGRPALAASMLSGSCALLILGLQPLFLSALVQEGRLAESAAGALVTVETLAIAAGSVAGIWLLRRASARRIALVAGLALAASNIAQFGVSGFVPLAAWRALAGGLEGVLVALPLVAISLVARVERASALFLALQTLLQAAVAALLPALGLGASRADSTFAVLAIAGGIAALMVLLLPHDLRPLPAESAHGGIGGMSLLALCGAGLFLGAIVSVWSYFGLWLSHHGYPPQLEGQAVAICLVAQVAGALAAARLPASLRYGRFISLLCGAMVALLVLIGALGAQLAIVYGFSVLFGFLWLFTLPLFAGWLVVIDPQRQAVLYLAPFQLCGAAALPLLAGGFVGFAGVDGILLFGGGAFLLLPLALLATAVRSR